MSRLIVSFVAGLLFALGLGISGMTQPENVLAFLDFSGAWNPALLFVLGGAVVVYTVIYRLVVRRSKPLLDSHFRLPQLNLIDRRLVGGAAVFGIGWGLVGYCPGPALMSTVTGHVGLVFVAAMAAGMFGTHLFERLATRQRSAVPNPRLGSAPVD